MPLGFRVGLWLRTERKGRAGGGEEERKLGRLSWPRASASGPQNLNFMPHQTPTWTQRISEPRRISATSLPGRIFGKDWTLKLRWGQACPGTQIILVKLVPRDPGIPGRLPWDGPASLCPSTASSQTLFHLPSQRHPRDWRWQQGARPFLPQPPTQI